MNTVWKGCPGGQFTNGRSQRVSKVTIHHAAGTSLQGVYNVFANAAYGTSATYATQGGTAWQFLSENDTPWSDGNWDSNCKSISIETVNSSAGGNWPIAEDTFETTAQLVADIHRRYGWANATRGGTITWHQMYYSTACPGPWMLGQLDRFVARVNEILKGQNMKKNPGSPKNSNNVVIEGHSQTVGDTGRVRDGQMAGTSGGSLRLEGLYFDLTNMNLPGKLKLEITENVANQGQKSHIIDSSDKNSVKVLVGTKAKSRGLEMLTIRVIENTTGKTFYMQSHLPGRGNSETVKLGVQPRSIGAAGYGIAMEAFGFWAA